MTQIVIKEKKGVKVDPRRPESHPDYEKAKQAAEIAKKGLKFESEGERLDYEKAVSANPNNIYGLPAFYPPLKIRSQGGIGDGTLPQDLPCGHKSVKLGFDVESNKFLECRHNHRYYEFKKELINEEKYQQLKSHKEKEKPHNGNNLIS